MTDTEMEGTEEAEIPKAIQPLHNPFLIAPGHKQHENKQEELNRHVGTLAQGPPTTMGPAARVAQERGAEGVRPQAKRAQGVRHPPQERARPHGAARSHDPDGK